MAAESCRGNSWKGWVATVVYVSLAVCGLGVAHVSKEEAEKTTPGSEGPGGSCELFSFGINKNKKKGAATPPAVEFQPLPDGSRVRVYGLLHTPRCNGRQGTILGFNDIKGRYQVLLDGQPTAIQLRPPNVKLRSDNFKVAGATAAKPAAGQLVDKLEGNGGTATTLTADSVPDDGRDLLKPTLTTLYLIQQLANSGSKDHDLLDFGYTPLELLTAQMHPPITRRAAAEAYQQHQAAPLLQNIMQDKRQDKPQPPTVRKEDTPPSTDLAALQQAAEAGNPAAQINLGRCYFRGDGVKQDFSAGIKWYCMAGDQGHLNVDDMVDSYSEGQALREEEQKQRFEAKEKERKEKEAERRKAMAAKRTQSRAAAAAQEAEERRQQQEVQQLCVQIRQQQHEEEQQKELRSVEGVLAGVAKQMLWQEVEQRFNEECPFCLRDFKPDTAVWRTRCGHVGCANGCLDAYLLAHLKCFNSVAGDATAGAHRYRRELKCPLCNTLLLEWGKGHEQICIPK